MNPHFNCEQRCLLAFASCFLPLHAGGQDSSEARDALEEALKEIPQPPALPPQSASGPGLLVKQAGPTTLRLIDISLDALFAAGSSTARDEELSRLQAGGHDPRKRGFTVQNVELSLSGAVDPYMTGEAHVVYFIDPVEGESVVELEEAFLTSQALPLGLTEAGFQIEAGQFFTEFGRINPQHPHQWEWLDQPVVNSRLFGPDGLRGAGFRTGWLVPFTPWFSQFHLGMQNANGETMTSFLANEESAAERSPEARPFTDRPVRSFEDLVYLLRWENGFDLSDTVSAKIAGSGLHGPNFTGPDGETWIYGADLLLKWRPLSASRGWPFVIWQTEIMGRDYFADDARDEGDDPVDPADDTVFASENFRDWGFYTQLIHGFAPGWALGGRFEYAGGEGPLADDRQNDAFRDDRLRVSPILVYHPTEFSRLRLQYNYDRAAHLPGDEAHSVWLGVEFLFGAHAAHQY